MSIKFHMDLKNSNEWLILDTIFGKWSSDR